MKADAPLPPDESADAWRGPRPGWGVPAACRAQHAIAVRTRVRVIALASAILVLAWIPIDAVGLERAEFERIIAVRCALAAGLIVLSRWCRRCGVGTAVGALFWMQAAAFVAMELCLKSTDGNMLRVGYGLFPFVVAAQVAILPLSWRGLLVAAPAAIVVSVVPVVFGRHPPGPPLWNEWWLLALGLLIASAASHSQMRLLVDLLGTRDDASRDPLTGLANRRFAEQRLRSDRARALRVPEPLSVLMVDIDHFKHVNDHWGHASGDRVLAAVAQVLRNELRGADLGVRHGGEEFLAILPGTGMHGAIDVAERIRARIEDARIPVEGGTIAVTASVGVATFRDGESGDELIARADAALYRAKQAGRNRCIAAPADPGAAALEGHPQDAASP